MENGLETVSADSSACEFVVSFRLCFRKSRRAHFHNADVMGSKAENILQSMRTHTLQHCAQPALVSWAHLKRVQLTARSQHSALFSGLCSVVPLSSHMLCNTAHPEACSQHQISCSEHRVMMSCHHAIIMSSCHHVIMSSCHHVIMSSCHHVIIMSSCSSCHHATL